MCSRFEMDAPPADLIGRFGLDGPPSVPNAAELRPTDQALVIGSWDASGPSARLLSWGLNVEWIGKPLINARAETLAEKKTFRPLLDSRCLVPATAYFEWRKDGAGKLKNRIAPPEAGVFAFAGLADDERFTLVTCAAAPAIAYIHGRMPVILTKDAEQRWIDPGLAFDKVRDVLIPYQQEPLRAEEETPPPDRQGDIFG